MKTTCSRTIHITIVLLLSTMLSLQTAHPQTTDSLIHASSSNGAMQFQLIGGIGVYYIGDWTPASQFRIGTDVSFNHSNQSGSNNGYTIYSYTPPSSSSVQENIRQPDQTYNSYQTSLSGLYLHNLAEYKHTFIYCGVGPMITYSWNRSTSINPETYVSNYTSSNNDNSESTNKRSGVGPLAIIGVRSRLLNHVSLSAELELSAVYQWTMQTSSDIYTSSNSSFSPPTNTDTSSDITHLNGWAISLNAIRVGLIIEL